MLDYGCGSGILAILAKKCGANPVYRHRHRSASRRNRPRHNSVRNRAEVTYGLPDECPDRRVRHRGRQYSVQSAEADGVDARRRRSSPVDASRCRACWRARPREVAAGVRAVDRHRRMARTRRLGMPRRERVAKAFRIRRIVQPTGLRPNRLTMLLATRCPFCETVFRLQPAQLALRRGLVRCGHCHEVFGVSGSLYDIKRSRRLLHCKTGLRSRGNRRLRACARAARTFSPSAWDPWAPRPTPLLRGTPSGTTQRTSRRSPRYVGAGPSAAAGAADAADAAPEGTALARDSAPTAPADPNRCSRTHRSNRSRMTRNRQANRQTNQQRSRPPTKHRASGTRPSALRAPSPTNRC